MAAKTVRSVIHNDLPLFHLHGRNLTHKDDKRLLVRPFRYVRLLPERSTGQFVVQVSPHLKESTLCSTILTSLMAHIYSSGAHNTSIPTVTHLIIHLRCFESPSYLSNNPLISWFNREYHMDRLESPAWLPTPWLGSETVKTIKCVYIVFCIKEKLQTKFDNLESDSDSCILDPSYKAYYEI